MLLLLASELKLGTGACGCRALKADVAVVAAARPRRHGGTVGTVLQAGPPAASGTGGDGEAGGAVLYGESKRMVPQGPNPLHN